MSTVILYARPGCHLCDEARAEIEVLLEDGAEFALLEVDIDTDDELQARLMERIPVVEVDGTVVSELWLDRERLLASLDTVRS